MERFIFMRRVLPLLAEGKFIRQVFAVVLRVTAVCITLAALVGWIMIWKLVFQLPASGILGGIVFQILVLIANYMVIHTMLIRAGDLARLPDSEFTVIPVASMLLRLLGEIYACFAVAIGIGGCVLIWFAPNDAWEILRQGAPMIPNFGGGSFVGGFMFLLGSLLTAFGAVVMAYFFAESAIVLVQIAQNTKKASQAAAPKEQS